MGPYFHTQIPTSSFSDLIVQSPVNQITVNRTYGEERGMEHTHQQCTSTREGKYCTLREEPIGPPVKEKKKCPKIFPPEEKGVVKIKLRVKLRQQVHSVASYPFFFFSPLLYCKPGCCLCFALLSASPKMSSPSFFPSFLLMPC